MVSNLLWSACDGFNGSVVVTFRSVVVGRPGAAGGVGRLGVDADRRSGHGALVAVSVSRDFAACSRNFRNVVRVPSPRSATQLWTILSPLPGLGSTSHRRASRGLRPWL